MDGVVADIQIIPGADQGRIGPPTLVVVEFFATPPFFETELG
jgi:hypothetical protein